MDLQPVALDSRKFVCRLDTGISSLSRVLHNQYREQEVGMTIKLYYKYITHCITCNASGH